MSIPLSTRKTTQTKVFPTLRPFGSVQKTSFVETHQFIHIGTTVVFSEGGIEGSTYSYENRV